MKNQKEMIILFSFFLILIIGVIIYFFSFSNPSTITQPINNIPSPTPSLPFVPTPVIDSIQQRKIYIIESIKELKEEQKILQLEDKSFILPDFIFDLSKEE